MLMFKRAWTGTILCSASVLPGAMGTGEGGGVFDAPRAKAHFDFAVEHVFKVNEGQQDDFKDWAGRVTSGVRKKTLLKKCVIFVFESTITADRLSGVLKNCGQTWRVLAPPRSNLRNLITRHPHHRLQAVTKE